MTHQVGYIIGTCSICGGPVRKLSCEVPARCEKCGAMAAEHGPVIPMIPPQFVPTPGVRYILTPVIYPTVQPPVVYPDPFSWPTETAPWPTVTPMRFTFCATDSSGAMFDYSMS